MLLLAFAYENRSRSTYNYTRDCICEHFSSVVFPTLFRSHLFMNFAFFCHCSLSYSLYQALNRTLEKEREGKKVSFHSLNAYLHICFTLELVSFKQTRTKKEKSCIFICLALRTLGFTFLCVSLFMHFEYGFSILIIFWLLLLAIVAFSIRFLSLSLSHRFGCFSSLFTYSISVE